MFVSRKTWEKMYGKENKKEKQKKEKKIKINNLFLFVTLNLFTYFNPSIYILSNLKNT